MSVFIVSEFQFQKFVKSYEFERILKPKVTNCRTTCVLINTFISRRSSRRFTDSTGTYARTTVKYFHDGVSRYATDAPATCRVGPSIITVRSRRAIVASISRVKVSFWHDDADVDRCWLRRRKTTLLPLCTVQRRPDTISLRLVMPRP